MERQIKFICEICQDWKCIFLRGKETASQLSSQLYTLGSHSMVKSFPTNCYNLEVVLQIIQAMKLKARSAEQNQTDEADIVTYL